MQQTPLSPYHSRNLETVARRWPVLAARLEVTPEVPAQWLNDGELGALALDGIHLASCFDPVAEAELQASLIPRGCEEAWVYGTGCGELPRALLTRRELRRLHVVVLNPALFRAVLRHYPHEGWLEDPRVELSLAGQDTPIRPPFCAIPPELHLAADEAAPLRDRIQLELDSLLINRRVNEQEEHSDHIGANLPRVALDGDVDELAGTMPGSAISVVAAGPTLDLHYGYLALPQPIIAVDRALKLLLARGIQPGYVLSIDPHPLVADYLDISPAQAREITLIYSPTIPPEALERWPGRRLAAYGNSPLFDHAHDQHPRGRLHYSGSVIHPAVDLAVRMGARHVLLFGADFAFPFAKRHANGTAVAGPPESLPTDAWVHDWNGERVATLPNLRGYLRDLEDYIAGHPDVHFYSVGTRGARIAGSRLIR